MKRKLQVLQESGGRRRGSSLSAAPQGSEVSAKRHKGALRGSIQKKNDYESPSPSTAKSASKCGPGSAEAGILTQLNARLVYLQEISSGLGTLGEGGAATAIRKQLEQGVDSLRLLLSKGLAQQTKENIVSVLHNTLKLEQYMRRQEGAVGGATPPPSQSSSSSSSSSSLPPASFSSLATRAASPSSGGRAPLSSSSPSPSRGGVPSSKSGKHTHTHTQARSHSRSPLSSHDAHSQLSKFFREVQAASSHTTSATVMHLLAAYAHNPLQVCV
jgi:hypothetical protein